MPFPSFLHIMVINIRQFLMLVLQIRHINQGDQLPAVEQSHAVANFLHLVQVVGREQDGQSLLPAQLPNELDELLNTGRSIPEVGSSRIIISGLFCISTSASPNRWRIPREYSRSSFSSVRQAPHAPSAPAPDFRFGIRMPLRRAVYIRFSGPVMSS